VSGLDLLEIDALLSDEEREVRAVVRRLVADQVRPHIRQWYEDGAAPVRQL
jgi:glutaryl-CoA dehydrogenase